MAIIAFAENPMRSAAFGNLALCRNTAKILAFKVRFETARAMNVPDPKPPVLLLVLLPPNSVEPLPVPKPLFCGCPKPRCHKMEESDDGVPGAL